MKKRVKIIAVFLVLVLVMQLIPIGVFADDVEVSAEQTQSEQMEDSSNI